MFKLKSATEKKANKQIVCMFFRVVVKREIQPYRDRWYFSLAYTTFFLLLLSQMIMFGGDADLEREGSGHQKGQTGAKKYHNTNRALTLYKNKTVTVFCYSLPEKNRRLFWVFFLYTVCLYYVFMLCIHYSR